MNDDRDDRDDHDDGGCAPIRVADDDGEILREIAVPPGAAVDRSDDGSITSIVTHDDDWQIFVDKDTELGARVHRLAAERGESAEEFVMDAVHEFLESERERTR